MDGVDDCFGADLGTGCVLASPHLIEQFVEVWLVSQLHERATEELLERLTVPGCASGKHVAGLVGYVADGDGGHEYHNTCDACILHAEKIDGGTGRSTRHSRPYRGHLTGRKRLRRTSRSFGLLTADLPPMGTVHKDCERREPNRFAGTTEM